MEERLKELSGEKKIDKRILEVVAKNCNNPDEIICCTGCTLCTSAGLKTPKMGLLVIIKNGTFLFLEGNIFSTIHEFYFKDIISIYRTTSAKAVSTLRIYDKSSLYLEFGLLAIETADNIIKELLH